VLCDLVHQYQSTVVDADRYPVARYRHSRGGIARPRFTATVRRPLVTSPVQPVASAAVVVSQPLCLPKRCVCTVVGKGFNSVRRTGVLECFDSEVPALWPACDHVSPSRIVSWRSPVGSIRRVVRLLATETLDSRCWDGSVLRSVLWCGLGILDLCVGGDWKGILCEGLDWLGSLCVSVFFGRDDGCVRRVRGGDSVNASLRIHLPVTVAVK